MIVGKRLKPGEEQMPFRCFICNKTLRSPFFPGNFMFWIAKPVFVYISTEEFTGAFGVCRDDGEWIRRNPDASETAIKSKLYALGKLDPKDG